MISTVPPFTKFILSNSMSPPPPTAVIVPSSTVALSRSNILNQPAVPVSSILMSGAIVLAVDDPPENGPNAGLEKLNVASNVPKAGSCGEVGLVPDRISIYPLGFLVPTSINETIELPDVLRALRVSEIAINVVSGV